MPTITCDDCGATLAAEPAKNYGTGPGPMTTQLDCPCGTTWLSLDDGTKWRLTRAGDDAG